MNSNSKQTQYEEGRSQEYDKLLKKAKPILEDLDYIDELPDPPKRITIPFPYGTNGVPRPYGWDIRS
ncbi:MAG: hypothetical protein OXE59_10810 [Bacteroidetes bacterium]|nr:hypothetical protein [Bacteroidota bacterium]MCY4234213.1 hypothetical protein [Bacteroidota bacterium]